MYRTWVRKTDKTKVSGVLYDVEDNKLLISDSFEPKAYDLQLFYLKEVYPHEIEKINVRSKGKVGRGFLFGFLTGATIGLVSREQAFVTQGTKAIVYGAGLGLIGAGFSTISISIPINGNVDQYKANQVRLKHYSYRN